MRRYFARFLLVFFGAVIGSATASAVVAFGYLRDVPSDEKAGLFFLTNLVFAGSIVALNVLAMRGYPLAIRLLRFVLIFDLAVLLGSVFTSVPLPLAVVGIVACAVGLLVSLSARYREMIAYFAHVRKTLRDPDAADEFMRERAGVER